MNQIGRSTTDCIDVEEVEKYFFTLFIGDVYGVTRQTPFTIENGGMRLSDCLNRAASKYLQQSHTIPNVHGFRSGK